MADLLFLLGGLSAHTSVLDDEGLDLPDILAARVEMRASALDLANNTLGTGSRLDVRAIDPEDESGNIIETYWVRGVFHWVFFTGLARQFDKARLSLSHHL